MKTKPVIISCIVIAIVAATIVFIYNQQYNLKKMQMDTLYSYFHKIQDSIKAKDYPINMDSLKTAVHNERNTISIYNKLKVLEDSVKSYHPR